MDLRELLDKLIKKCELTEQEAYAAMDSIAMGKTDPMQIAAFLALLRAKGETASEVYSLVNAMLKHCIDIKVSGKLLDIVGTGGDGANTANISTGSAILSAACGARVGKHGNRSVSSKSGSADVLEALGIPMLQPAVIAGCIEDSNIAFMYSPHFHPAMRHVVPVRRGLGVRTVFNILGPLLNPAKCKHMIVGVCSPDILNTYAEVFHRLGVEHSIVVHCCGLDELNPIGPAEALEIRKDSGIRQITIDPEEIGVPKCTLEDLKGGDAEHNAKVLRDVFSGGDNAECPVGNTIAFNAGAGLYVYGLASSIKEGYEIAKQTLVSGKALETMEKWVEIAQDLHSRS